jgi:hypothetical protein
MALNVDSIMDFCIHLKELFARITALEALHFASFALLADANSPLDCCNVPRIHGVLGSR